MEFLVAIIGGYLIGSIPFGLILTRAFGYGDIRAIGSGNIGATNVLRTGNKKLAMATLVLDAMKGMIAVYFAILLMHLFFQDCSGVIFSNGEDTSRCQSPFTFEIIPMIAGFFALIGHLFPIWLKFKGGKGVATTLGTLLALKPIIGIAACGLWLLTAIVFRYSSLSALVAIGASPIFAHFLYGNDNLTGLCGVIATLVFYKHRANIQRLLNHEEPKIGQKK